MRRLAMLSLLVVAVLGAARAAAPRTHTVRMRGNSFAPRTVTVTLGDTVTWLNTDIVRHNAVRSAFFDSGDIRPGESFSWVPADTGTVRYECTIHTRMRGTIRVQIPR